MLGSILAFIGFTTPTEGPRGCPRRWLTRHASMLLGRHVGCRVARWVGDTDAPHTPHTNMFTAMGGRMPEHVHVLYGFGKVKTNSPHPPSFCFVRVGGCLKHCALSG